MCLRPLSLSLSTRGAPYLVYSVIKGRFLLIHGFNKTRSIGSSAPHSTIIFFLQPSKFEHNFQKQKSQNQDSQFYFLSWLSDIATSWTRSRRVESWEKLIIICRDFAPRRAEAKQEDDDFITKKKSITQKKITSYQKYPRTPFFALCLHYILRTRERGARSKQKTRRNRTVCLLLINRILSVGRGRNAGFNSYWFQFLADSDHLWIMRQKIKINEGNKMLLATPKKHTDKGVNPSPR